jgi:hypothetical protein
MKSKSQPKTGIVQKAASSQLGHQNVEANVEVAEVQKTKLLKQFHKLKLEHSQIITMKRDGSDMLSAKNKMVRE